MLKTASQGQRAERKKAKFDVEIASVATAVPTHKICQAEITKRAGKFSRTSRGSKASMAIPGSRPATPASRQIGITSAMDGKRAPPCSSADLLEEVALKTTNAASIGLDDIGALIVNTITGLAIPSLDAKLMNRLQLPHSVGRLPIFGLGCGGGVGGLAAPLAMRKPCRSARMSCFLP
jgi:alkylresorcinol/alkylpyrone synthase